MCSVHSWKAAISKRASTHFFERDQIPWAVYAVDSVLVNAGRLRNSVTVKTPSVVEDSAAGVTVELEEGAREVEAADAGEAEEEEDVEEAAVTGKRG